MIRPLAYRGTSLTRKRAPLEPYRRPMPRVLGGYAFSYGRGTPVGDLAADGGTAREVRGAMDLEDVQAQPPPQEALGEVRRCMSLSDSLSLSIYIYIYIYISIYIYIYIYLL